MMDGQNGIHNLNGIWTENGKMVKRSPKKIIKFDLVCQKVVTVPNVAVVFPVKWCNQTIFICLQQIPAQCA